MQNGKTALDIARLNKKVAVESLLGAEQAAARADQAEESKRVAWLRYCIEKGDAEGALELCVNAQEEERVRAAIAGPAKADV